MFKKLTPLLPTLAVLLAACGPQGTPTLSPEEVSGTAIADAWAIVTMTAAAVPTSTPTEVPSPTALPTLTPLPLPTLDLAVLASPTSTTTSGDPCDGYKNLVVSSHAKMTRLRLQNEAGAPVTLSIYLYKTAFGDCGYSGYSLSKGAKTEITFPQGCYFFAAIVNNPKNPSKSFGGGEGICANNDDLWVVRIGKEQINLQSP